MSEIKGYIVQTSELNFFKDILETRKTQIVKNLDGVYGELDQLHSCELNDECDHVSVNNSAIVEVAIVKQLQQELKEIDISLAKISSEKYGVCEMCGEDIGFQRLKVKPHAVYCIHCKTILEKSKK